MERRNDLKPPLFIDGYLVATTLALVSFSVLMLYSTTGILSQERFGDSLFYVKRQGVSVILGLVAMWIASKTKSEQLQKISPYLLPASLFLLVLTLIPGLSDSAGGAKRWVKLGPIRFQPGEFVKLMMVIFMAGYYARHEAKLRDFVTGILKPLMLVGCVGFLFLCQPDFGSTVVLIGVSIAMAAAAGIRFKYLSYAVLFLVIALGALVVISPYRLARITTFLSPFSDVSGKGYQLIQSLIAVGTGQLTGVGLGESQQKLFFLPAAHTDFIFAVIAEELGFIGCLAIIGLFLIYLWRGLRLASAHADDTFAYSLSVGLTLLVVLPALLNIGVVTGILPTKGMVLPLLGYGGTNLISTMTVVGFLLAFARTSQRN